MARYHFLRGRRLALPAVLSCMLLAGCQAAAISSSVASSSTMSPSSSSSVTAPASSTVVSGVPLPAQGSSSALVGTPPAAEPATLQLSDFSAYLAGSPVLGPLDVAFQRFSFRLNALGHKLDPLALTTQRGIGLGASVQQLLPLYGGLPVDIRSPSAGGNWVSARYEDFAGFLETGETPGNYYAVFFLYMVDGAPVDLPTAQAAIAENAAGRKRTIHRYELIFHIQEALVSDILLSFSNTTPFDLGNLAAPQPLLDTDPLKVQLSGLFTSPESFGLYLGLRNGFNQPLVAVCTATFVSGKATRDPALLYQHIPAFSYVNALLEIPNDTARAAEVEKVYLVSFTIELRTEQGRTVYNSGPLTASFSYPEDIPPA